MMRWRQTRNLVVKNATYAICVKKYDTLASVIFLILQKINVSRNPIKSLRRNEKITDKHVGACCYATIVCVGSGIVCLQLGGSTLNKTSSWQY